MPLSILTSLAGVAVLVTVVRILRRPELERRAAARWIAVSLPLLPVLFAPSLLDPVAVLLRVRSGADLVLASGLFLLSFLAVAVGREQHGLRHRSDLLSAELSSLRALLELPTAHAPDGPPRAQPPVPAASAGPPTPRGGADGPLADLLEDGSLR
ncbi:hypothetical protein GCM10009760_46530 [Kitasatospora kazusensis]|uniref:DUF2304 domain-containing protein n=1 Tax=Kitasatospora kazusensis TaxID=407974 RepID=A0ABN3A0E1_9ACTN